MEDEIKIESRFYDAEDLSRMTGLSKSHCYKVLQQLNKELKEKGYITFNGRVPKEYVKERLNI